MKLINNNISIDNRSTEEIIYLDKNPTGRDSTKETMTIEEKRRKKMEKAGEVGNGEQKKRN